MVEVESESLFPGVTEVWLRIDQRPSFMGGGLTACALRSLAVTGRLTIATLSSLERLVVRIGACGRPFRGGSR